MQEKQSNFNPAILHKSILHWMKICGS